MCVRVCTVGAEQGLKLSQQSDGGELPQKSGILQTVPQFDDEATDQRGQLQKQNPFSLFMLLRLCVLINEMKLPISS